MQVKNLVVRVKMPDSFVLNNVYQFEEAEFDILDKLNLYRVTIPSGTRLFFNAAETISFSYEQPENSPE